MITTPRAALKAIFARLANLPVSSVAWKGEVELSVLKPPASLAISGATNASPIVLTVPQGLLLPDKGSVFVAGVGGNTAANGGWYSASVIDAQHVSLDGSTGNGAYTTGGTIQLADFDDVTGNLIAIPWRWGLLRVGASSREGEGWDAIVRVDNGDGTSTDTSIGARRVTLSLEYFSYDPTASVMADDVLEDLRTKLWHGNILDAFNAINGAPVTYGNVIPLPGSVNGREVSAAHLDVVVRLAAIDKQVTDRAATTSGKNTWIHEVKGTGTVTNEAGAPITIPLDVVGS